MNQNRNVNLKLWEDFLDKFNKLKNFVSVALLENILIFLNPINLSMKHFFIVEYLIIQGLKLNGLIQKN